MFKIGNKPKYIFCCKLRKLPMGDIATEPDPKPEGLTDKECTELFFQDKYWKQLMTTNCTTMN